MKITLNHNKFSKALQYTSRAVSSKPNIPILSNVLLDVTKTDLKLSATNLDMGINMWIPGVVDVEGKTTVSAKYIADFVTASFSDKLELERKDTVLNVKTSKSKANFATIPAQEFPVLPNTNLTPLFTIATKEFISSIEKVVFACSLDLSAGKIQQSGVLFEFDTNEVSFIGLDGFRLSKRSSQIKNFNKEGIKDQVIVPSKYLNEVVKIIQDYPELEEIEVCLSDNKSQIIFKFENIEVSIRLIEGPYPEYKKIIPDSEVFTFEVPKTDLEEAIKIINTFARSNLSNKTLLDFDVENAKIRLKSSVAEVGDNETVVEVFNPQGSNDLNAAYNLRYIQDVVNHIHGDTIIFSTKGPLSPSVFRDKGDEKFIHLLMPLRRDV